MDRMMIGNCGRAQGIKGEIRLNLNTDNPAAYEGLKRCYIGGVLYHVESIKALHNGVIAKLKSLNDRNSAELLVNKTFEIDRCDAIQPEVDRYYVIDLIGCRIVDNNGQVLGILSEILQHGAADVYVVVGDRNLMFPALKDAVISTDISIKTITVKADRLKEIAVYED